MRITVSRCRFLATGKRTQDPETEAEQAELQTLTNMSVVSLQSYRQTAGVRAAKAWQKHYKTHININTCLDCLLFEKYICSYFSMKLLCSDLFHFCRGIHFIISKQGFYSATFPGTFCVITPPGRLLEFCFLYDICMRYDSWCLNSFNWQFTCYRSQHTFWLVTIKKHRYYITSQH